MVVQAKMAFQRMGSGGKGKTQNRWDVSDTGQSAPPGSVYFHGKYIKKSQRLTVRPMTDLFLVTLQSAVL